MLTEQEAKSQMEYEEKTVAFNTGVRDVMIAEAREVFDRYRNSNHWKDPITAKVPVHHFVAFVRAVEFYHGVRPKFNETRDADGNFTVTSPGYIG